MIEPSPPRYAPLRYREFVLLIAMLLGLNAIAIDIMLPVLGLIGTEFGVADDNDRQIIVSSYVLGLGLGQMVIGPLLDRYGRRGILLGGLVLYICCTLACTFAPTFHFLLVARLLQGLASSTPRVASVSIVRDCTNGTQMAKVMSTAMIAFMCVPIFAPSIGMAISALGSWRLIFGFVATFGIVMTAWSALRLPETLDPRHRRPLDPRSFVAAFAGVLKTRQTVGYLLTAGLQFGMILSVLNSVQQIYSEIFGVGAWFPVIFGATGLASAFSNFLNSRLVYRLGPRAIVQGALVASIVVSLILLGFDLCGRLTVLPFALLVGAMMFLGGMLFANMNALAMEPQGHVAGTASSVIGSLSTIVSVGCGFVVGQAYDHTLFPFCLGMFILGVAALGVAVWTERGRIFILPR